MALGTGLQILVRGFESRSPLDGLRPRFGIRARVCWIFRQRFIRISVRKFVLNCLIQTKSKKHCRGARRLCTSLIRRRSWVRIPLRQPGAAFLIMPKLIQNSFFAAPFFWRDSSNGGSTRLRTGRLWVRSPLLPRSLFIPVLVLRTGTPQRGSSNGCSISFRTKRIRVRFPSSLQDIFSQKLFNTYYNDCLKKLWSVPAGIAAGEVRFSPHPIAIGSVRCRSAKFHRNLTALR